MNLQHALMYCSASTINFSSLNQWYSKWGLRPLPGSTISRLSVIIILRQYLFFSHSFSHKCKVGVSKLSWSAGQIRLCPFIYIFPSAVFSVQQQSWVTVTEHVQVHSKDGSQMWEVSVSVWPTTLEIFSIRPFTKHLC